jgi:hypothetical protein
VESFGDLVSDDFVDVVKVERARRRNTSRHDPFPFNREFLREISEESVDDRHWNEAEAVGNAW